MTIPEGLEPKFPPGTKVRNIYTGERAVTGPLPEHAGCRAMCVVIDGKHHIRESWESDPDSAVP